MAGKDVKQNFAMNVIKTGKAEEKLREIIAAQGGNPQVQPEDIKIGDYGLDFCSSDKGVVMWINNTSLIEIGRAAGAPKDKGAGIVMYKKIGHTVTKGEKLFTVYAEKVGKLERVKKLMEENNVFGVGEHRDMLIHEIKEMKMPSKSFMLDR
jgi:AMP phosphorylase